MPPPVVLLDYLDEEEENVVEWFHEVFLDCRM
jgi:hypothetical protein